MTSELHPEFNRRSLPIDDSYETLLDNGARPTHPAFSVANQYQYDVVLGDKRMLLTDNMGELATYNTILGNTDEPILNQIDAIGLTPEVAAVEIPRDARSLRQVSVAAAPAPDQKISPEAVFLQFGRLINHTGKVTGAVPDEHSINLRSALYSRTRNAVIFVPGVRFEEDTTAAYRNRLVEAIHSQLLQNHALGISSLLLRNGGI